MSWETWTVKFSKEKTKKVYAKKADHIAVHQNICFALWCEFERQSHEDLCQKCMKDLPPVNTSMVKLSLLS